MTLFFLPVGGVRFVSSWSLFGGVVREVVRLLFGVVVFAEDGGDEVEIWRFPQRIGPSSCVLLCQACKYRHFFVDQQDTEVEST